MILIWIHLIYALNLAVSEQVTSYFLNSEYKFRNDLPNDHTIDCVHTDHQNDIHLSQSITLCYRTLPITYTDNNGFYLATSISFGTIDKSYRKLKDGLVFGVWDLAYWLGIRREQNGSVVWVPMGDNLIQDLQIWRHICLAINFKLGTAVLVEKGVVVKRTKSIELMYEKHSLNHVAVGCFYRGSTVGSGYITMYGKVADLQIFGTFLSDLEMIKITRCTNRQSVLIMIKKSLDCSSPLQKFICFH